MIGYAGIMYNGMLTANECDCGAELTLQELHSPAGWYLGRFCPNCGPSTRESDYYAAKSDVTKLLPLTEEHFTKVMADLGLTDKEFELDQFVEFVT